MASSGHVYSKTLFLCSIHNDKSATPLCHPELRYLFLVGGFAESPLLQHEVRREFGHLLTLLIPQDVSLAVLRGWSLLLCTSSETHCWLNSLHFGGKKSSYRSRFMGDFD